MQIKLKDFISGFIILLLHLSYLHNNNNIIIVFEENDLHCKDRVNSRFLAVLIPFLRFGGFFGKKGINTARNLELILGLNINITMGIQQLLVINLWNKIASTLL